MRFAPKWVCVISYCGCMSYDMHFSANQLGGLKKVCVTREYALSGLWVKRESTVADLFKSVIHLLHFWSKNHVFGLVLTGNPYGSWVWVPAGVGVGCPEKPCYTFDNPKIKSSVQVPSSKFKVQSKSSLVLQRVYLMKASQCSRE